MTPWGTPEFPIRQPGDMIGDNPVQEEVDSIDAAEERAEREAREADEPLRLSIMEAYVLLLAAERADDHGFSLTLESACQKLEDWLNAQ
jgi:hypothetical protein